MVESLPILNRQRQKVIEKYFVRIYSFLVRNINLEATNAKGYQTHTWYSFMTISSELGMRPLMERVLSRREVLGA